MRLVRDRIMPALAPRMATRDAAGRQRTTTQRAMALQRDQCIGGARRLEPAGRSQPGTQHQAIRLHHADQPLSGPGPNTVAQRRRVSVGHGWRSTDGVRSGNASV
jgi:hypothetical protein